MRCRAFGQASVILVAGLAAAASRQPLAQAGRAGSDAADVGNDALLGTANRATLVPQSNRFATPPRLGQQAPGAGDGLTVQPGGPAVGDKR
jgi:hypothetical protein